MPDNFDKKDDSQLYLGKNVRTLLVLSAIIAVAIISLVGISFSDENLLKDILGIDISEHDIKKAAIINMLHDKYPNPEFIKDTTNLLVKNGYKVDLYSTKDATIELYKKLPTLNYELIVFRTHGLKQGNIEESSTIFSGEVYTPNKHQNEQWAKQVGIAVPYTGIEIKQIGWENLGNQTYFTIGSKFVNEVMEGEFSDTLIIIGGCDSLSGDVLAKSFVNKGASVVIGWNELVTPDTNDDGTFLVLSEIVNGTLPIDATKKAMEQLEIEPRRNSKLMIYSSDV